MVTVKQCTTMNYNDEWRVTLVIVGYSRLLWVTVGYDTSSLEIIGLHETDLGMEVSSP